MRLLRSFSIVTFVLLLVLALAGCQDGPTLPSIGTLQVTPVALTPCGNFSAPLMTPQGLQMVDCGW